MTRKVLVVDDDAAILEVLTMRLGAMGFDVTPVSEGLRALEAAAAQRFDLALIDLRMGPMDGVQLMEALHAQQRRLPVLIMTAHGTISTGDRKSTRLNSSHRCSSYAAFCSKKKNAIEPNNDS